MNKPFSVQGAEFVTPKGKAMWCKFKYKDLDRKFDKNGIYSTQLILDPNKPEVKAFIERLEAMQDQAYNETVETLGAKAKGITKRDLFSDELDKSDEPTGNIVFKFALKNVEDRRANGKPHEIMVVDSQKQKVKNDDAPLVGNGSTIRVASFVYPYYSAVNKQLGLSLMWTKMQLIDLVEYSPGGSSNDFDEEDGFAATSTTESFGDDDF